MTEFVQNFTSTSWIYFTMISVYFINIEVNKKPFYRIL